MGMKKAGSINYRDPMDAVDCCLGSDRKVD